MLHRVVQKRPIDWKSLLAPVLQLYRLTIIKSKNLSLYRLAVGCNIRLPVDFGTLLLEPARDVWFIATDFAIDLEWRNKVEQKVIGPGHRRDENRYNKSLVKRAYPSGTLVRVLLYAHFRNVPLKLSANYFGLCEVVETSGSLLTLQEFDTQRVFTTNHDAVSCSK